MRLVAGLGFVLMGLVGVAEASPPARVDDDPRVFTFSDDDIGMWPMHTAIIDVERMAENDCRLDRRRGGICVLRGFDVLGEDWVDVDHYATERGGQLRIELLERLLDTVEVVDFNEPMLLDE